MPAWRGRSRSVRRSRDTAWVPRRRREARVRLRQEWLRCAQVWASELKYERIRVEEGVSAALAHSPTMLNTENRVIPITCGKSGFCCSALAQMIDLSKV